jgi:hypothetical protein
MTPAMAAKRPANFKTPFPPQDAIKPL